MFILIFATLFASFLLASSSAASVSSRVPRVSTTSGVLSGSSTDNISTFLGVPYAQPPIGDLRWKTALPINSSRTAFDATQFGAGCGQLVVPGNPSSVYSTANIETLPTNQSEDCLSLNIWAPKNAKRLPVIIFVHGGGYQSGVSSTTMYHGDHVAETGRAIFVSINYRLNIWGFPSSTPVDGLDQNIGITDVRLAIEWVATNIAQFGGDPAQIIFSGQSAGATIGEQLLYAFDKDPIFVGQIALSGIGIVAAPTDGTSWNLVSNALGCGNFTDVSQVSHISEYRIHTNVYTWCIKVSCMRNVNFDQINNATLQLKTYFGPYTDGTIILDNAAYLARGANGSFAHVPALISNVNDEGSLFVEPYSSVYPNGTTADFVADTTYVCPNGISLLCWVPQ